MPRNLHDHWKSTMLNNSRFSKLLVWFLISAHLVVLQSGCYTYSRGEFVRTETLQASSEPSSHEARVRIASSPTVKNPKLIIEISSVPVYEELLVDKHREIRVIVEHKDNGIPITLSVVGGMSAILGAIVIAGGNLGNEVPRERGWIGFGGGLLALWLGLKLYDGTVDTLKVPTGKLVDGERRSVFREDDGFPIANYTIEVKYGTKLKKTSTDQFGRLSIHMVEDFELTAFDRPETIVLHILANNPRLEQQIEVSSKEWTVPYFRAGNATVRIRSSSISNSNIIGTMPRGEELLVLDEGYATHVVQFGTTRGYVDANDGALFWSIPERFDPKKPPSVSITGMEFTEPSGDNYLDAEEAGTITLTVMNRGTGPAHRVKAKLEPVAQKRSPLSYETITTIGTLQAGEKKEVSIAISAPFSVQSQRHRFRIEVAEANGFDADPKEIEFESRAFRPPDLAVVDQGIEDFNRDGIIELGEPVEVTVRVQNRGLGDAQEAVATVTVEGEGQNIFYHGDSRRFTLGTLKWGKYRDIKFTILTNKRYTGDKLPVFVLLEEKRGQSANIPLPLPLSRPLKRSGELIVMGKQTTDSSIPDVATLTVDVDVDIPVSPIKNPDAVAVVIGISSYQNRDVFAVDYARRDATVMRQYLTNTMGFDRRRIIEVYDADATLGAFKRIFEEQLPNYVRDGRSDVFVFYSGHGVPDPETREAYFVPYDCNPTYAKSTGYRVNELYERLSKLKARNITVVIDACFSGSSERGMLLKTISPVFITVENPILTMENAVVFTSSTGQQVATWYHEMKHGLFSYYFLKGLRGDADFNNDKKITVGEMERYLLQNVPDQARYHNHEQTPQVMAKDKQRVLVKY